MSADLVRYDDLFVYAPSFTLYERSVEQGCLWEGKAVGTAKEVDLVLLDKDRTMQAFLNPEQFGQERRSGRTVGKKKLREVQQRTEPILNDLIVRYQAGKLSEKSFRTEVTRAMKVAWRDVFVAGVRASGIQNPSAKVKGAPLVQIGPDEERWFRSAVQHEMRFLNGMLSAIVEETFVMPLPRRVGMYMDALESFFDSARVIGLPANIQIHWLLRKRDKKVCASCLYLDEHSPYSKKTLPTTPRSGLTLCLTNCRDRLLIRMVESEKALQLHQSSPTRGTHIKALRRIKRLGHL